MISFSREDLKKAEQFLRQKKAPMVLFSEGTYQVEIVNPKKPKESFWPFLQLSDDGQVLDALCTCKKKDAKPYCLHLAAAYIKIMGGKKEPLHVRFRDSLWNILCQIAGQKYGYEVHRLKSIDKYSYQITSITGQKLFSLTPLNEKGKKYLQELLFKRPLETEETSLKFSQLSHEELILWKQGKPSQHLRYELSFWSDFGKWLMLQQEEGKKYEITFSRDDERDKDEPPNWIEIKFSDLKVSFYIAEADWEEIIPILNSVKSSLVVYEHIPAKIEKMIYLEKEKKFRIEFGEKTPIKNHLKIPENAIPIGEWLYVPNVGFFPKRIDPLITQNEIPEQQINLFLNRYLKLIQKHLQNFTIHPNPIPAQYTLEFDKNQTLNIRCFALKEGDLTKPDSAYFGDWVFLEGDGFYYLDHQLFSQVEKRIEREKVTEFVSHHRNWLQSYEGFQPHMSAIESQLSYRFLPNGTLEFYTKLDFSEETEQIMDFGEWVYVKGRGFYAKQTTRTGQFIKPGIRIPREEIAHFIQTHREELETIPKFFYRVSPIQKSGLHIFINQKRRIQVRPEYFFHNSYQKEKVKFFGNYTYVENEGFALIPTEFQLPEGYKEEREIDPASELFFVGYELDLLYPHVISIDVGLKKPKKLFLRLNELKRDPGSKVGEWISNLSYETDVGKVDASLIWRALSDHKLYLFTPAGLLSLKDPRFEWLKEISKKRWLSKGEQLRLNTLEWLRLSAFEEIQEPLGDSKKEQASRTLWEQFQSFEPPEEMNLEGLKSDLRPYQYTGVRWLWFLYCYGLSGLLCDEMGLGKTHQAMALLAAVNNKPSEQQKKYLVVCPTSVIYHWEQLCKRFLPNIPVYVFHGIERKLSDFEEKKASILLTSYGIVRSERTVLSQIFFEVAIYDELQIAKNIHSQTHKSLRTIHAKMRLGLTGTPIENRIQELKALFDVILPTYFPSDKVFQENFVIPIEKYGDEQKKQFLHRFIRPFILRRKKKEVLQELPEKVEEIAYCDLSGEQRNLYNEYFLSHRQDILDQMKDIHHAAPLTHIFQLFSKLKQICDHPCLITKQLDEYQKHSSGKWELFKELLDEARESNQKVVIFSQYLGMLDIIEKYLKEKNIGFAGIRGSTKDRKEQVEKFRDDPQCEVFVGSLQAAGVGIDLVAASIVIHYDRWWNPAKENQATDRVHRIGQNRGVQVFKMVSKGTIEEHIHRLIEKKTALAEGIISFDDQDQIKGLKREEIIELFQMLQKEM